MNHKNDLGSLNAEVDNELGFNSDDRTFKNDFKLAVQPKDLDLRYQIGFNCQKQSCTVRNDFTYKLCNVHSIAAYLDWNFHTRKFGAASLGFFHNSEFIQKAFTLTTDFSKDGCPLGNNGSFDWRVIFKATDSTKVGFHYNWTILNATQALKLGFQT